MNLNCVTVFVLLLGLIRSWADESDNLYPVEGVVSLPDPTEKLSDVRVELRGNDHYTAIVRFDGTFVLHNIPAGTYALSVYHIKYRFTQIRIDISSRDRGRVRAMIPERRQKLSYPLEIKPDGEAVYFQVRPPMNIMGMFKGPMMFVLLPAIIVLVLPKMIGDPDEFKKAQAQMAGKPLSTEPVSTRRKLPHLGGGD